MSQRLGGESWKIEKSWKSEKSNQNIVVNEKFVKNNVMNAKIGPKVVMELSIFKIGGWNNLHPINQHLLDKFIGERVVVGDRNSKQRFILCDTVLGATLCEFRTTQEEIDVTS